MLRFATVLLTLATATTLAGCARHDNRGTVLLAPDTGFQVLTGTATLPQGHPPVDRYHGALPEGHPPVAGHGLPPGHPVCPAGRQLLERGAEGTGEGYDSPRLISI